MALDGWIDKTKYENSSEEYQNPDSQRLIGLVDDDDDDTVDSDATHAFYSISHKYIYSITYPK